MTVIDTDKTAMIKVYNLKNVNKQMSTISKILLSTKLTFDRNKIQTYIQTKIQKVILYIKGASA